jgi:2-oxoglutarate ferredoxin oxidoreductase subunit alpha
LVGQGDMMQAKWGSHGDLETIAYCPSSVQEFFDLTIQAFNTAERFRTPVFVMADQVVGMMWEKLRIPPPGEAKVQQRKVMDPAALKGSVAFDYLEDFNPMPIAGTGCRVNIDSLTHDAKGYPSTDHSVSEAMIGHLTRKIRDYSRELWMWEESLLEDAEVVVVAYGSTARSALAAVKKARASGIKAGLLRLITAWPFPDEIVDSVSRKASNLVVAEVNNGQMLHPIAESSRCPVVGVNWAPGTLIGPDTILDALEVVAR